MSLNSILRKIHEELSEKEEIREELQKDMRKATRLSKRAILLIHQDRLSDALSLLKKAQILFIKLEKLSKNHLDLLHSGFVSAAYEEYSEAQTLLRLVGDNQFLNPEEFSLPVTAYVLSLGDVIGELRRRTLNSIRQGKVEPAEKCLELMEHIYSELIAIDDACVFIHGLRRKCDVARHLIEITRGDVALEVRRSALERTISKLQEAIDQKNAVEKNEI